MDLFKKKKKDKKVPEQEPVAPPVPVDPSIVALEKMAGLVDQVNAALRDPDWPRSHRLYWDFTVRPPRLVIQRWSQNPTEVVYPVPNFGARKW